MTGELWWNRLVNSVRFLEDIQDCLEENKSVILLLDTDTPWTDIMIETLTRNLSEYIDAGKGKSFETIDLSTEDGASPGELLEKRFRPDSKSDRYWPTKHGCEEIYLAQQRNTPLNRRYVYVTEIPQNQINDWVTSVNKYLDNCPDNEEHGVFILIVKSTGIIPSKHLTTFKYSDYISDYDCMMLCLTLLSDLSCGRTEKMYLAEVASNIAHNHVELASLLVSEKLELLMDPEAVTRRVYSLSGIEVGDLSETVHRAVWEAQIKLIFPKLENFRAEIIRKYETKLEQFLPIRSSNNDRIEKASDLEIGQLFYVCKDNRDSHIVDQVELDTLRKMRDARNTLAHMEILSYKQLKSLNII